MGTGADLTEFAIHSGGTISIVSPIVVITSGHGPEMGHFAVDVHEIGFNQDSAGNIGVVDLDFEALLKAKGNNVFQPAANTNILPNDIVPSLPPADFRTQVIMSNAGDFSVVITHSGTTQVGLLNANSPVGPTLMSGALYIFDVLVSAGDSINFQYSSTGGIIRELQVQEIDASAY